MNKANTMNSYPNVKNVNVIQAIIIAFAGEHYRKALRKDVIFCRSENSCFIQYFHNNCKFEMLTPHILNLQDCGAIKVLRNTFF